tara:strand:+ start:12870 stop:14024 length:1155 start_codon:yes stop_codon:yes gene_type:complete
MRLPSITELNLKNKKVLLRVDLNTPMLNGEISNDERIVRSLPTIQYILDKGARLIILSHLGRPDENNVVQEEFSLNPVRKRLEKLLNKEISLYKSLKDMRFPEEENLAMLENTRFFVGEKSNDSNLSKSLAAGCDIYVMDAFATSHRAHASTTGIVDYSPQSCCGFLIIEELEYLEKLNKEHIKHSIAVLGGAKISTKLSLIKSLSNKMDFVVLGGGLANTCLAALGKEVGNSLIEEGLLEEARSIAEISNILLPETVLVSDSLDGDALEVSVDEVPKDKSIFDISPLSLEKFSNKFQEAEIILWNGPMGVFEKLNFSSGTRKIATMIGESSAFTVGGGGDTIAASEKFGVKENISYMSTAGGAFLAFVEGRKLPSLEALTQIT